MEDFKEIFAAFICPLLGVWVLYSSIKNRNSFFDSFKASIFVAIFTRTGARIFYGVVGVALIGIGFKVMYDSFLS